MGGEGGGGGGGGGVVVKKGMTFIEIFDSQDAN